MATVVIIIFVVMWSVYVTYCFIKGKHGDQKFGNLARGEKAIGPLLMYLTVMVRQTAHFDGTIYGTTHSLSYLVANAAVLNKRVQRIDIIAQVQYGIRVFDMGIGLSSPSKSVMTDSAWQKIGQTIRPFFEENIPGPAGSSGCALVATNNVITDLSLWHTLEILNQTAHRCAIAKLIIAVSFVGNNEVTPLADDKMALQSVLKQIKAHQFVHLFII